MKRAWKSIFLFILFPTIVLLEAIPCQAAPKAGLEQNVYDAGKVFEGSGVSHDFLFKNTGDQVLLIKPRGC